MPRTWGLWLRPSSLRSTHTQFMHRSNTHVEMIIWFVTFTIFAKMITSPKRRAEKYSMRIMPPDTHHGYGPRLLDRLSKSTAHSVPSDTCDLELHVIFRRVEGTEGGMTDRTYLRPPELGVEGAIVQTKGWPDRFSAEHVRKPGTPEIAGRDHHLDWGPVPEFGLLPSAKSLPDSTAWRGMTNELQL
jgi:hypothetical protein